MQTQKGSATIVALIVLLLTLGGAIWYFKSVLPTNAPIESPVAQRQEAKTKEVVADKTQPVEKNTITPLKSNSPAPTALNNEWKVFKDSRFNFQFSYPAEWSIVDKADDPYGIQFWAVDQTMASVIMDVFTGIDLRVMGISYCEANSQDKRCETVRMKNGAFVTIDWGTGETAGAMYSGNGISGISFILRKVNDDTKSIFRKILSTFRFVE